LNPLQPYGYRFITLVALAGAACFALGCVTAFVAGKYATLLGLLGVCLCWPYFGLLAVNMPWNDFTWLIRIHEQAALLHRRMNSVLAL
jgi:hypothetical protein